MASGKGEIVEIALKFMPDWVQVTVIGLVALAFVASWGIKLKRKIDHRRAVRTGQPVHAAAQYGQGRGADHLGAYAPRQSAATARQSGADFLGAYAPRNQQDNGSA